MRTISRFVVSLSSLVVVACAPLHQGRGHNEGSTTLCSATVDADLDAGR